jgi:hypothetical protein
MASSSSLFDDPALFDQGIMTLPPIPPAGTTLTSHTKHVMTNLRNKRLSRKDDEYLECPHCRRFVYSLFKTDLGCTMECSLAIATVDKKLYNRVHALCTRITSDVGILPALPNNPAESADDYWDRMFLYFYPHHPDKLERLKSQWEENQYYGEHYSGRRLKKK